MPSLFRKVLEFWLRSDEISTRSALSILSASPSSSSEGGADRSEAGCGAAWTVWNEIPVKAVRKMAKDNRIDKSDEIDGS